MKHRSNKTEHMPDEQEIQELEDEIRRLEEETQELQRKTEQLQAETELTSNKTSEEVTKGLLHRNALTSEATGNIPLVQATQSFTPQSGNTSEVTQDAPIIADASSVVTHGTMHDATVNSINGAGETSMDEDMASSEVDNSSSVLATAEEPLFATPHEVEVKELVVKQLSDRETIIPVQADIHVGELRNKIRELCQVPNERQRLLWRGRPLSDDNQSLADLFATASRPVVHLVPIPADMDIEPRQTASNNEGSSMTETSGGTTIFMFSTSFLPEHQSSEAGSHHPTVPQTADSGINNTTYANTHSGEDEPMRMTVASRQVQAIQTSQASPLGGLSEPAQPVFSPSMLGRDALSAFTRTLQSAVRSPNPPSETSNISQLIGQFITEMSDTMQRQQPQQPQQSSPDRMIDPVDSQTNTATVSSDLDSLKWSLLEDYRERLCRLTNTPFLPLNQNMINSRRTLQVYLSALCQAKTTFNSLLMEVALWQHDIVSSGPRNLLTLSRLAHIGSELDTALSSTLAHLSLSSLGNEQPGQQSVEETNRRASTQESVDTSIYEDAIDEPPQSPETHTADATTGSARFPAEGRSESVAAPIILDFANASQISAYMRPLSVSSAPPQHVLGGAAPTEETFPEQVTPVQSSMSPVSDFKPSAVPDGTSKFFKPVVIERRERRPLPDVPPFNIEEKKEGDLIELSRVHPSIHNRIKDWTGDPRRFSASVLPYARRHPPSRAYSKGCVVGNDGNLLDFGNKNDDVATKVTNPANSFRLQWHRAALHERLTEHKVPSADLDRLTKLHNAQNLLDIAALVEKDPNYKAEEDRYPVLRQLINLIAGLKSNN